MGISVSKMICIAALIAFTKMSAQVVVTNISPTRITVGSEVTITGSGFNSILDVSSKVSIPDISIEDVRRRSDNTITFKIRPIENESLNKSTNDSDPFGTDSNDELNKVLSLDGIAYSSFPISYIAPTIRDHRVSNGTNRVERITEIFTNLNGFWRSSWNTIRPDDKHELLGFTYDGITYSTGVNDQLLTDNGITSFVSQNFKAYSTNGISGSTNNNHYLAIGDLVDELVDSEENNQGIPSPSEIEGLSIYNSMIDGINGLELGTGITNLNQNNTVRFFSGNGQVGALGNDIPDLIITQIAQAGERDIYYYADLTGNVVGRPIRLFIDENSSRNPPLATWNLDLFRYQRTSFDLAVPASRNFDVDETRPLRMLGFRLEEFAIDVANIGQINNINMSAGGKADLAFMAYNQAAFDIKSPRIISRPISRYICELTSSGTEISFEITAGIEGEPDTHVPSGNETLDYQWYYFNTELTGETNPTLTVNVDETTDLGLYRVIVTNGFGASIVPVSIEEGGTPAFWNNTTKIWEIPSVFGTVADSDRLLVFGDNYEENVDLEGCDCEVQNGVIVTIKSGKYLKLYSDLFIRPEETDGEGNVLLAGQLIIEDDASLLQTKDIDVNDNVGEAEIRRQADNLEDLAYVYWSSPVSGFDIDDIPNNRSFYWDVRAVNSNGTDGNWVPYNGVMDAARGYIARAPSTDNFTVNFKGVPNNGLIPFTVLKSNGTQSVGNQHWNLIGNPYPSALNADKFLLHPANDRLVGAVYIWTRGGTYLPTNPDPYYQGFSSNYSDQYVTYNLSGPLPANGFDGDIASGQGFFVKVRDDRAEGEIEFRNTMRYEGDNPANVLDNTQFYRTAQNDAEKQRIWLSLVNQDENSVSTLIGYVSGATEGKDRLYDAPSNAGSMAIYSLLDNEILGIQGRPLPFNESDVVYLGARVPETGIYSIGIDKLDGEVFISEDTNIILEDTYTGTLHDLKEAPYTFNIEQGSYNDRFILRYNANQLSTKDVETPDTFAYIKDRRLHIQSSGMISEVQVYDLSGKSVMDYKPESSVTRIETDFNFSRGAYITLITLEDNITVSKKLMN